MSAARQHDDATAARSSLQPLSANQHASCVMQLQLDAVALDIAMFLCLAQQQRPPVFGAEEAAAQSDAERAAGVAGVRS